MKMELFPKNFNARNWRTSRRQDQHLVLFYKIINDSRRLKRSTRQPTPVQGRITASNSNTSRQIVIHIGTLFFPATISSWNNLPFGIEKVDSVEGFKLKLKEHTFMVGHWCHKSLFYA